MELNWLEDFLALADCKHFGQAAERRSITQPAFSRRIRLLEQWIGAPLFDRQTHRVELTSAGENWKPTAEDVLRRLTLGREQTREVAVGLVSNLRFASTHALSITFFPQWLQSIEADCALDATISLITDNMAGCERAMLQAQAHFLLCHHHPSSPVLFKPNYFVSMDIGTDVLIPVSAPDAGEPQKPKFVLPGSFAEPVAYLAYSDSSGMGRIIAAIQALNGPSVWLAPAFTAHLATVLATMARSARGVAWLPLSLIEQDLRFGTLLRAGDETWDLPIDVRLYRPRARQSTAAEAFWEALKLRSSRSWEDGGWAR